MSVGGRYARQMRVAGVGDAGQARLGRARVLLIGAGGLGAPAALYLAGAGVGTLGIVDDDVVDLTNLHRQIVHTTASVGAPKTDSARRALIALNPEISVETFETRLTRGNAVDLLTGWDIVLDGSDDFATRYLVGDATTLLGIPHVWASVMGSGGQLSVFDPARDRASPVYRDLFPAMPAPGSVPSCAQAGVLPVVPGILGVAMAAEALKIILGTGTPLVGRVAVYDMLTTEWEHVSVRANTTVMRPRTAAEVGVGLPRTATVEELARAMRGVESVRPASEAPRPGARRPVVLDVRTAEERAAGTVPGSEHVPVGEVEADAVGVAEVLGVQPVPSAMGGAEGDGEVSDAQRTAGTDDIRSAEEAPAAGTSERGDPAGATCDSREVYVFCASGSRSARAVHAFRHIGVDAIDVLGGYEAWERRIAAVPNDDAASGREGTGGAGPRVCRTGGRR